MKKDDMPGNFLICEFLFPTHVYLDFAKAFTLIKCGAPEGGNRGRAHQAGGMEGAH